MVAQLFNTNHGLKFDTKKDLIDLSMLNIDDAGDSRYVFFIVLFCALCTVPYYSCTILYQVVGLLYSFMFCCVVCDLNTLCSCGCCVVNISSNLTLTL
jgi:hypothetical protein